MNQRFASFYFTQTAFDCCHQNLNHSFESKTFQHLISSQPCDFFSLTEHLGICCSILCSQARVSSLDNSLKMPPALPKNAFVPAWQITLAHTSFRHSQNHRRSLAHLATALSSDDVSGWRKGAQPGTLPSGIFFIPPPHTRGSPSKKVCETGISSKRKRGHKHSVQAVSAHEFVQPDRVTLKLRRECDAVRAALQTLRPVGLLRERRRLKKPTCHHNVDTQRRA